MEPDIILYPSRWKMLLLTLGSLLFVLCGPLLWTHGDVFIQCVAVADVFFFGFCGVFALGHLLWPRPSLVISASGITDNASAVGAGFIGWDEIAAVSIESFHASQFLVIVPHDPQAILARQPLPRRWLMAANMGLVGSPITIPNYAAMPLEEIERQIGMRMAARQSGMG